MSSSSSLETTISSSDEKLLRLYQTKKFSDFTIICNGNEFPVHKWVLDDSCGFFRKLFDSEWKETSSGNIFIPDGISDKAVETFLFFLYTSSFPEDENELKSQPKGEVFEDVTRLDGVHGYLPEYADCNGRHDYSTLQEAFNAAKQIYPRCGGITYEPYTDMYTLRVGPNICPSPSDEKSWIMKPAPQHQQQFDGMMLEMYLLADYFQFLPLKKEVISRIRKSLSVDTLSVFMDWVKNRPEDADLNEILVQFVIKHHSVLVSEGFPFHELGILINDVMAGLVTTVGIKNGDRFYYAPWGGICTAQWHGDDLWMALHPLHTNGTRVWKTTDGTGKNLVRMNTVVFILWDNTTKLQALMVDQNTIRVYHGQTPYDFKRV